MVGSGEFSGAAQCMANFVSGKAASAKAALDDANKENNRLTEYNSTVK